MISFIPDFENIKAKEQFGCRAIVYTALDGGEAAGKCVFSVDGSRMFFHFLDADRLSFAAEGLIRSSLSCGAGRGAYTAYVAEEIAADDFLRLGFTKNGRLLTADIPDILMGGCTQ